MPLRSFVACTLLVSLGLPPVLRAGDHVVSTADLNGRLDAAARARAADLATLDAVLSLPEARRAAARFGVRTDRLRQVAGALSDADLHALATPARALRVDPVAGTGAVYSLPVWPFVLVLLVLIGLIVWGLASIGD